MNNPHSKAAEAAVVAALLQEPARADVALCELEPDDFFDPALRELYVVVGAMLEAGETPTPESVTEALRARGKLEYVGGPIRLRSLQELPCRSDRTGRAIQLVKNTSLLRTVAAGADRARAIVQGVDASNTGAVLAALDEAQEAVYLNGKAPNAGFTTPEQMRDRLYDIWGQRKTGRLDGVPTGLRSFDAPAVGGGLHNRALYVIMGLPGSGKTALMGNLAWHQAVILGRPVALVSLEMSREELVDRLVCAHIRNGVRAPDDAVALWKIRHGGPQVTDVDWRKVNDAYGRIAAAPLHIDDEAPQGMAQIRAKLRRLQHHHPDLAAVYVDYVQLIDGSQASADERDNRALGLGRIAYALKNMAKQLDVPVVVFAQVVEKEVERRGGWMRMSDVKESGSIVQAADVVVGLRPHYVKIQRDIVHDGKEYAETTWEKIDGVVYLDVLKNRHGQVTGGDQRPIRLDFEGAYMRISEPVDETYR